MILDEPTSDVDPIARDEFWRLLVELSRRDKVTIFITTHFINEAARCDCISLMHAGKALVSESPEKLAELRGTDSLKDAFIGYLVDAVAEEKSGVSFQLANKPNLPSIPDERQDKSQAGSLLHFSLRRMLSYTNREAKERSRDPIRLTMAGLGSVLLMFITITRGTFSKALGFADLTVPFYSLLLAYPVLLIVSAMLLKKQEQ